MICARSLSLLLVVLTLLTAVKGALPNDISNFQNEYVCDTRVRLVRPRSISDVEEAVKQHTHVKAVGVGYSYNRFSCAAPPSSEDATDSSANIVMTAIRPLTIDVNESEMSVWVSAGVVVWDLMVYLGNYVTPSAPKGAQRLHQAVRILVVGYALGATPGAVNQTVGGAIATNTHGSSLTFGSLSNQAIGFRVVMANGTTTEIYPGNHPFYFKAFQVNVGRLGVVTDVKLRIIKETLVKKTIYGGISRTDFMPKIKDAQEAYRSTGTLPEWMDDMHFLWIPVDSSFVMYTLEEAECSSPWSLENDKEFDDLIKESQTFCEKWLERRINAPFTLKRRKDRLSIAEGVKWDKPIPLEPKLLYRDARHTGLLLTKDIEAVQRFFANNTLETHEASYTVPLAIVNNDRTVLHDFYEVAVPVDKMADCLEGFLDLLKSQASDTGLRSVVVFRLVGKEEGLLSVSHDKPHLWFSLQDLVYYNQDVRQNNLPFQRLMAYLSTSPLCAPARLHWGKAGWSDLGCRNMVELYGKNWCDFGCAVQVLDPGNKFTSSASEVWNWEGANLDTCCEEQGYDTTMEGCGCEIVPRRRPEACSEAPSSSFVGEKKTSDDISDPT